MKNKEVIEMLDKIKELIKYEQEEFVIEYIERKKIELKGTENLTEEYIEDLVKELK